MEVKIENSLIMVREINLGAKFSNCKSIFVMLILSVKIGPSILSSFDLPLPYTWEVKIAFCEVLVTNGSKNRE